jgi:hypothetical protein
MKTAMLSLIVSTVLQTCTSLLVSVCAFNVPLRHGDSTSRASGVQRRCEGRISTLAHCSTAHEYLHMVSWLRTSWVVRTFSNPHRKKALPAQEPPQNREAVQLLWV